MNKRDVYIYKGKIITIVDIKKDGTLICADVLRTERYHGTIIKPGTEFELEPDELKNIKKEWRVQ